MKVAIIGSRRYHDLSAVWQYVAKLPRDTVIISGGAKGVDTTAIEAAAWYELDYEVFLPDWKKFGTSAGPRRNLQMVQAADRVVAFWDGESAGTRNAIKLTRQYEKPLEIIT